MIRIHISKINASEMYLPRRWDLACDPECQNARVLRKIKPPFSNLAKNNGNVARNYGNFAKIREYRQKITRNSSSQHNTFKIIPRIISLFPLQSTHFKSGMR